MLCHFTILNKHTLHVKTSFGDTKLCNTTWMQDITLASITIARFATDFAIVVVIYHISLEFCQIKHVWSTVSHNKYLPVLLVWKKAARDFCRVSLSLLSSLTWILEEFLLRFRAQVTNRNYCNSQREALMDRLPIMITPIG